MIRVQFYFIFIFLFDPSWSESIRVDPTRTGGPSWSGPTFVPAFKIIFFTLQSSESNCRNSSWREKIWLLFNQTANFVHCT